MSSFLSNKRLRVVLGRKFSKEYPVNAGVSKGFILDPTFFLLYINDITFCNIAIYDDYATLYSQCDESSDLWQQLEMAASLEPDLQDRFDIDFNAGKTQLVSSDWSNNTGVIDVKIDGSVEE